MRAALVFLMAAACSREATTSEPTIPWKLPPDPAWGDLPTSDGEANALTQREALPPVGLPFDTYRIRTLRADASHIVAGEDAIAAAFDAWMRGDSKHPEFLLFGTLHDSGAQIAAVASIVMRMKTPWAFALEQLRAKGKWNKAPDVTSADDDDLATLTRSHDAVDSDALWRVNDRQTRFDHAAWKFGYVPVISNLIFASRGAGIPLLPCDMPTELRTELTAGSAAESALRELHCARALRGAATTLAINHPPEGGLSDDDPQPPERIAILLGANHAEPTGLPRFLGKTARSLSVRVLGGRPRDAGGEESELSDRLVVMDTVLVRGLGPHPSDVLLLPDDAWGGTIDRTTEPGRGPKFANNGLSAHNVVVTSDEAARFSIDDSSIDVGTKEQWVTALGGKQSFVLVSHSHTIVGSVDVRANGYTELHFSPNERSVRIIVHSP